MEVAGGPLCTVSMFKAARMEVADRSMCTFVLPEFLGWRLLVVKCVLVIFSGWKLLFTHCNGRIFRVARIDVSKEYF